MKTERTGSIFMTTAGEFVVIDRNVTHTGDHVTLRYTKDINEATLLNAMDLHMNRRKYEHLHLESFIRFPAEVTTQRIVLLRPDLNGAKEPSALELSMQEMFPVPTKFVIDTANTDSSLTPWSVLAACAAIRTLDLLRYTYVEGSEMWKPPVGKVKYSPMPAPLGYLDEAGRVIMFNKTSTYESNKDFLEMGGMMLLFSMNAVEYAGDASCI